MIVEVACATGQAPLVLMDEPLWVLLWTFAHVQERETRHAFTRRQERIDAGILASFAFSAPESLNDELRTVHEAVDAFERGPEDIASDVAALRAAGEAMLARGEAHKAAMRARGEEPTVTLYS